MAVTIVGIGMASVLQSIAFALGATRAAKDYLQASSLLSQKIWELNSMEGVEPGSSEGVFQEKQQYHYRVSVEEVLAEANTPPPGVSGPTSIAKVSITVFWDRRGKTNKLIAETYLPVLQEDSGQGPKVIS